MNDILRMMILIALVFLAGFDFSCATFHAYLTEAELIKTYGQDNVTRGPVVGADDGPTEGTILFADQKDARVEIAWLDVDAKQRPLWIRVQGERSQWRTVNGIGLGDDLRSIERMNQWPFRLGGFASEMQGTVQHWGRGRFGGGGTSLCNVRITFQPRSGTTDPSSIRQVNAASSVSSGHPAMQKINPQVVAMWITFPPPQSPANPDDAVLDVLVFGTHMPIDPARYPAELRREIEQYLRRAAAYHPKRPAPSALDMRMVHAAQVSYETRLVAVTGDPNAHALAQAYVTKLRPCYEWEGFPDCPERDARFADAYQAANPSGPFSDYLPLLSAHRWLCAAEAYDHQKDTVGAERSRRLYEQKLAIARQSKVLLIRTAAERLAARGRCHPPN